MDQQGTQKMSKLFDDFHDKVRDAVVKENPEGMDKVGQLYYGRAKKFSVRSQLIVPHCSASPKHTCLSADEVVQR